ncbi:hypothetical protein NE237_033004 [Protea cynaroides]|uniref:TIR domain-containing protein n=1 Tax=Protea cynaroides TaxID=273540 RepID=A0A9Q0R418_9MAGN|nr:hypothetical protein NE237_033004 [Protea cynaroides]
MAAHDGSCNYQVFISYRWEDTGNTFTGFLHSVLKSKGIDAFIDRENLPPGEEMLSNLFQIIRRSKISIPVISKRYADSKWCLIELTEMVERYESKCQTILPIFFDIELQDVKYQTGIVAAAFEKHKEENDEQTLKRWKKALTVVGGILGYQLKDVNGNQSKLVNLVVEWALTESSSRCLADVKNPVGLSARVEEVEDLLKVGSNDSEFVGICGISGIGKTTIAISIYNRNLKKFRASCFLANITKEASKGLEHLQKLLIEGISNEKVNIENVHRGKILIQEKLQGVNVLLVLDDVNSSPQLDALAIEFKWFGRGSRIIITSQDEHILDLAKVDEAKRYHPGELDDKQSLHLFSLHAFSTDQPPEDFKQFCQEVLHLAGGLPLTLEVLGSSLFGIKEKEVWKSMLQRLKHIPPKEVHQKLKISYDNLEVDEQSIFLDAACFFVGWRKDIVISMWEACGFEAVSAIKKLTQRSLLKFTNKVSLAYKESISSCNELRMHSYEELGMHDQIQAMGRGIVSEGSPRNPGKRSRLWSSDDILEVFEEQTGTAMIEGILPSKNYFSWNVCLHREVFSMMSELRFLCINGTKPEVIPRLPSNLRWFTWSGCLLEIVPTNFYHKKLIHMDLSKSRIKKAWTNNPQLENKFQKLKVLSLQDCKDLLESPNFSWFPYLEKLNLNYCHKMATLHNSIGDIKSLLELNLVRTNIKELPESICKLSSLKRLNLSYCYSLEKLPESIGDLKSLVDLDLISTKIEKLPDNICKLSSLERLFLGMCSSVTKLPEPIGDLKSLMDLDVGATKIEELPDSICKLTSLKMLDLYMCSSLQKLPDNICNLNSLVSLVLQIVSTEVESLPELPSTLTHLSIKGCISLRKADFSSLKRLRILKFGGCEKLEEIGGLEETESLEKFQLLACNTIESIPKLPSNLTTLEVRASISVQKLPNLSSLKKLRILNLSNCKKLGEIRGLEGTESLEEFHLLDCDTIESLPELPSTLTFMRIIDCNSLQKLPDLSSLKYLRTVRLQHCKMLEKIRGLEGT